MIINDIIEIKTHSSTIDSAIQNGSPIENIENLSPSTILQESCEDILAFAQGDAQSGLRIFHSGRYISQEELMAARQKSDYNGQLGEKLIDKYFELCKKQKNIMGYDWTSKKNPTSPYDFKLTDNSEIDSLLDVKSTSGNFTSRIYISAREIITMAKCQERYDLYRVYDLSEIEGILRIAQGMRDFAQSVLASIDIDKLRSIGVHVDSFSVDPKQIENHFGEPIQILFSSSDTKNS